MDFDGDNEQVSVHISDYNQVGAFFFQTDGPELYPHSVVRDIFYHTNDDGIKAYYSNVTVESIIVWKCLNDPIVQMGWKSRNVSGITIDGLTVIHSRYTTGGGLPAAILGASGFYNAKGVVHPEQTIQMAVSNVVCEGQCPALMKITPLQSYNLVISNVSFQALQPFNGIGESTVPAAPGVKMVLSISNWSVGNTRVTMGNFQSDKLGKLDIAVQYWGEWSIN
jgi:hypothetical protein